MKCICLSDDLCLSFLFFVLLYKNVIFYTFVPRLISEESTDVRSRKHRHLCLGEIPVLVRVGHAFGTCPTTHVASQTCLVLCYNNVVDMARHAATSWVLLGRGWEIIKR